MLANINIDGVQKIMSDQITVSYTQGAEGKAYLLLLNGAFGSSKSISMALNVLLSARATDTIKIVINSPGGVVHTLELLLSAIAACKARVTLRAAGMAASCGGFILPAGDALEIGKPAMVMYHNITTVQNGNAGYLTDWVNIYEQKLKYYTQQLLEAKLLTEEEVARMLDKKLDIYLTYSDLKERGVCA